MELKDKARWDEYVKTNTDPYGKACVDVARRAMEILDQDQTPLKNGYFPDIHTSHGIICKADMETNAGGITGFMAGCVAQMVFECHERGDEFRKSHNGDIQTDGVVNHAVIGINL